MLTAVAASPPEAARILRIAAGGTVTTPAIRHDTLTTIEDGGVVLLLGRGFELTPGERQLMADRQEIITGIPIADVRDGKPTIIYEPWRGRIKHRRYGAGGGWRRRPRLAREVRAQLEPMMARFGRWAATTIADVFPEYVPALTQDRITYRPHERSAVQPLHVDSSYGYPTHGRGMFRLFCNVDPSGRPRVWQVGESFEPFARRFLASVRLRDPGWRDALLGRLPLTRWRRSLYDEVIAELRLHGKRDKDYQRVTTREIVEFPSGSSWLALTDLVLHGAISGRHSLDQTFFLPATGMTNPWRSSLYILEKMMGRALA